MQDRSPNQGQAWLRAELHMHTHYSPDCSLSMETIIRTAVQRKLDVLAITDHNRLQGALELQRQAPFAVIASEEVRCLEGELIGYYLTEEIPRGLSARETAQRIRGQGGAVCVPHPFDRFRRSRLHHDALLELVGDGLVDIIEVSNARVLIPADNGKARRFADAQKLLFSGGSDAHSVMEIGRTYLELPPFHDKNSFLIALGAGRVVGRLSLPLVHAISTVEKWRKRRRARQLGKPS